MPQPQYILNQPKEKLLRWARENREMATKSTKGYFPPTPQETLLRWAEELEKLAQKNSEATA